MASTALFASAAADGFVPEDGRGVPASALVGAVANAAGTLTPTKITLDSIAADVGLKPAVATLLWDHLDVDPSDVETAAAIPEGILNRSLEAFHEDNSLSAGDAGRISRLFKRITESVTPAAAAAPPAPPAPYSSGGPLHEDEVQPRLGPARRWHLRSARP